MDEFVTEAYQQWGAMMVRVAYRITGDWAGAEDCAQEAMLAYALALRSGSDIQNHRAWLFTTVKRKAINWACARKSRWKHEVEPTHLMRSDDSGEETLWDRLGGGAISRGDGCHADGSGHAGGFDPAGRAQ